MKNTDTITEEYNEAIESGQRKLYPLSAKVKLCEEEKRKTAAMCMVMTVVSFIGYLVENTFTAIKDGFIDNRNMFLPLLFGYGISMTVIYLLFGTPMLPRFCKYDLRAKNAFLNTLVYFSMVFCIVSVGEILLGTIVEQATGIVWWDYTSLPLNVTKYTSVPTSIAFGAMITLFMGCVFKPLCNAFMKIENKKLYRLATVFMVLMTADFIHSGLVMFNTGDVMRLWRISF